MLSPAQTLLHHLRRLTCPPTGDAVLLSRWINGRDEDAFAALVARHGPMVFGVCRRVLGDGPDAEDAFQATCLILARKAASLRRPEALAGWLHGVASRLAWKTRAARRHDVPSRTLAVEPADSRPDPLDLVTVRELLALLDREIGELPEVYRLPVVLCDLEGRTQEEAAEMLGWTLGSLRGRLLRGRTRLKNRLARRGLALSAGILLPLIPATLTASAQAAVAVLAPQTIADVSQCAVLFSAHPASAQVPARAAELARDGLRVLMLSKAKIAAVVMMSICLAGAGLMVSRMREAKPVAERREDKAPPAVNAAPKPAAEKRPVRLDRFGDPLPEGAVARLGTVRWRHGSVVSSVAFSSDRKTLASGGQDNRVRLWEIATGKELQQFTAVTGPGAEHAWVQSIAFSPDGRFLAAATSNGSSELVMWELATAKEVRRFQGVRRPFTSVAFAPDGKTLAASDVEGMIRLWNVADGEMRRELKGHQGWVESIAFSPKGETLASASRDKTIRLWNPVTGRELRQLKGHTDMVLAVAFTPDGQKLASGSWDKTIRLWDTATGGELRSIAGHFSPVSTVVFLADGKTLASGSWDSSIRLWDTTTGKEQRQMQGHHGPIPSIALSPNGQALASGSWDRTVRLWDVANGRELRPTEGHHHSLWSVAVSPDGKQIASADEKGEVRLWDAATSKEVRLLQSKVGASLGLVDRLEFSADGRILHAASWGRKLCRWQTATGKPLGERMYKGIGLLATPDDKLVVGNDGQGTIFVQEAATGKVVREFKTQKQLIAAALSPDGKVLAAGSPQPDGTAMLWELATGKERCRCKGAYDQITRLEFSPDGKYLAGTTTRRGFFTPQSPVHLWDAATGREVRQFRGQPNIHSLAFAPDGRTLASGGHQTVHLWETATGKERRVFQGHQGYIRSLVFSSDGTRLISASDDTTALIWDATGVSGDERLAGRVSALWTDLASEDAAKAYRAVWLLARHPAQSVPLLRKQLPAARALDAETRKQVERLLTDLDSEKAMVRDRAALELAKRGGEIEPILRKGLTGRPSLEQRKRIERVLERLEGEKVTLGRALESLEHANTPEARQLLETLAAGEAEAWRTREAKAALQRVQARKDK